jgi:hypothetical protein
MRRLPAVLMLGALVAGCVPAPPTTPREKAIPTESLGLGGDTAPAIGERWWTELGDDQLDRLVAEALTGNPPLAAALARVRAAQAQFAAARSALYPQATLDANDTWQRLSANYIFPPPLGGSNQWMGTIQANLTWSLDYFGKQQAQIERARSTAAAAAAWACPPPRGSIAAMRIATRRERENTNAPARRVVSRHRARAARRRLHARPVHHGRSCIVHRGRRRPELACRRRVFNRHAGS